MGEGEGEGKGGARDGGGMYGEGVISTFVPFGENCGGRLD